MTLPALRRRKRARPGESPAHLKWVRKHRCCVRGCANDEIEAAHVRTGTNGGMGMKPTDRWAISLCTTHHHEQHSIGERRFEEKYALDMSALAEEFARKSPHRRDLDEDQASQ